VSSSGINQGRVYGTYYRAGVQISEEATNKLGSVVAIDVLRPVQAYNVGGEQEH
jgi:hypothetical protein